ncbi:MAG TPA: nuclease A inhibitor family protein [Gemmataceae bacterium]|nr:nuclease A inhibitor family protein [Gemmataceae bacterium]
MKAHKVGDEAEKQVYIVGKTTDGKWAGLNTTGVETEGAGRSRDGGWRGEPRPTS